MAIHEGQPAGIALKPENTSGSAKGPAWEHFEHRADIGVRGYGADLADAFAAAGQALTAIVTDPARVRPEVTLKVHCDEADPELLFIDWLNLVIYEMAVRRMLFSEFAVTIDPGGRLRATMRGEALDRSRHEPAVEIKGATFTALDVHQCQDGSWIAQCVVDV
jgi:tRNA nucleotidyltransferase (CCA-adding enzyme)